MDPAGDSHVRLHVGVLGAPFLRVGDEERGYPAGRPGRLLAALLLARGRVVPAERLIDEVWGEEPPEDARAALHTTVNRVRKALGPAADRVVRRPPGYLLSGPVTTDADEFLTAAGAARVSGDPARFDDALALWRGPAWAELGADLAAGEALRLEEARLTLREERAGVLLAAGRIDDAVGELRVLAAEQPLRERPVGLLMRALHAAGDVAEALAAYDEHRTRLADELGLDPSVELVALHRQVLERSLDAPPQQGPPSGAPELPVVHLLGRETHLASIRAMLAGQRCVTVVGPGGVGKTSVAAAAARSAAEDRPVWWVDLATTTDPAAVLPAVADAAGAQVFPGGTVDAALRRRLETRSGLLVLDNCEHLVGACGDLVEAVLRWSTGVTVLATSRERLGVAEEHVFPLPPLQLSSEDAEDLGAAPAVALFVDRARAAAPGFTDDPATLRKVARLTQALDGLPLAIELAAGRLGSVTLDDLSDRLTERLDLLRSGSRRAPARHRTLTATVEWSFDLLSEEERRVLLGLSVFAGPFDLAAAEAVLGAGVAGVVADLVERSLVVGPGLSGRGRYRLLDTLRAFTRGRLSVEDADRLGRAHAEWATGLAVRAGEGMTGAEEGRWSAEIEAALADLAAAFRWSVGRRETRLAATLVGALQPWAYYHLRPDVLGWASALVGADVPRELVPGVHLAASGHCWMAGRYDEARAHAQQGLAATEGRPTAEAARCLSALGDLRLAVGEPDAAHAAYAEGAGVARTGGLPADAAVCDVGVLLARVFVGREHTDELATMRETVAAVDNPTAHAFGLYGEGEALAGVAPEEALRCLVRSVEAARAVANSLVEGVSMTAELALLGRSGQLDKKSLTKVSVSVRHWLGSGNENLFVTCLRNVVPLLGRLGAHEAVAELGGALEGAAVERPSYGQEAARAAACFAQARTALGERFDDAWRAGAGRSTVQAAEAVLAVLAGTRAEVSAD
jgi:predicted ATPase/DNA-binding SARP family transcriptional activator